MKQSGSIIEENEKLITFLGFIYKEEGVLINIGDIYDDIKPCTIYSKTPIAVNDFGEGEKYFKELPNPDYGKEKPERWRNDLKTLSWGTLNHYRTNDLKFHESFDALGEVISQIEKLGYSTQVSTDARAETIDRYRFQIQRQPIEYPIITTYSKNSKIQCMWEGCSKFVNWYNNHWN